MSCIKHTPDLWDLGFYQRSLFPLEPPWFQPDRAAAGWGTLLAGVYNEPSPADELELGRRPSSSLSALSNLLVAQALLPVCRI